MIRSLCVLILVACAAPAAFAQSLGTFRWHLQPYCNVVTLTVAQAGGVYTLDGFDDQCDAATRAPVTGTAVPNVDGTIEIGLNIVNSPGAAPLHVAVPLSLTTLGGPWKDSAGGSGTFAFAPNGAAGGNRRPATAALGAVAVNPAQVQLRVMGTCNPGQVIHSINQDGTVTCEVLDLPNVITSVSTPLGGGLQGGTATGHATLRLATTSSGAFDLSKEAGLVAASPTLVFSEAPVAAAGPGKRLLWYPAKAAFRVGAVDGNHWDAGKIGNLSVAMGFNTTARGATSFAMGRNVVAAGHTATAIGELLDVSGDYSIALGYNASVTVGGSGSFVFGDRAPIGGDLKAFVPNQFLVRAVGGTTFYTNADLTSGVKLATGASSWSSVSDVNMKEHFRDLDGDDVLAKIARMPIREWSYKSQDASTRHIGPTAQDFHAAFGLGEDPLRISTIDADGVALRAIQALEARTRETDDAVTRHDAALREALGMLKAELAALRTRLDELESKR